MNLRDLDGEEVGVLVSAVGGAASVLSLLLGIWLESGQWVGTGAVLGVAALFLFIFVAS